MNSVPKESLIRHAEEAVIATAVGAGFAGLRPVAILMHAPFVTLTLDAIL